MKLIHWYFASVFVFVYLVWTWILYVLFILASMIDADTRIQMRDACTAVNVRDPTFWHGEADHCVKRFRALSASETRLFPAPAESIQLRIISFIIQQINNLFEDKNHYPWCDSDN